MSEQSEIARQDRPTTRLAEPPGWMTSLTVLALVCIGFFTLAGIVTLGLGLAEGADTMWQVGLAFVIYGGAFGTWGILLMRKKPVKRWYLPQLIGLSIHSTLVVTYGILNGMAGVIFDHSTTLAGTIMAGLILASWPIVIIWLVVLAATDAKKEQRATSNLLDEHLIEHE